MLNPLRFIKKKKDSLGYNAYREFLAAKRTTLDQNFIMLRSLLEQSRQKKVALVGQPGAGKSSLLLKLTDGKCEPPPKIGVETNATDWSRNESIDFIHSYASIDWIDVPGYGTQTHPIKSYQTYFPIDLCQVILFVIQGKIQQSDEQMFQTLFNLSKHSCKVAIIRTLSEHLSKQDQMEIQKDLEAKLLYNRNNIPLYFISNRTMMGIEEVKRFVF